MTGLIAGAVSDRQRAAETTRRLESRAEVAWAGVAAKVEAVEAKERVRQDAKAAAERELEAGDEEAAAANTRTLQARVAELENLLASTLDADPYLTFDQLKEPAPVARFRPPPALATAAPPPQLILPEPPRGIAALGRRRAHAQETAQKRAEYEQAAAEHRQAEHDRLEQLDRARTAHESAVAQARERVRRQHASIEQLERDFADGKPSAVGRYFREVLSVQSYPGDFPTGKVGYKRAARELVVDIDLPLLTVIRALLVRVPAEKEGTPPQETYGRGAEQAVPAGHRPDDAAVAALRHPRGAGRARPDRGVQRLCRLHQPGNWQTCP